MTTLRNLPYLSALITGVLCVSATAMADAVTRERSNLQNGSGACQAALPAFEGLVRKRPLALQNESVGTAFASCSMVGTGVTEAYVGLINNSANPVNVTCTLVDGLANEVNKYFTKTVTVPTSAWTQIGWTDAADNAGAKFRFSANASCNLPAGVGISYTIVYYEEDVGA